MKVLFVLTSHSELGSTGNKTGFWVEEFAAPYYVMVDKGVNVSIASPKGGQPPIDPKSEAPDAQTEATKRYFADAALREKVAHTKKLSDVNASDFDAVFYPGGHGPLWDLYEDKDSIALIQNFWSAGKPVAAVCHAPSALLNVKDENGDPLVKGKNVTGFTNSEEEGVQLTKVVPYLLEDELKAKGGIYSSGSDWSSYVVKDGKLITGQNPASSEEAAKALLAMLEKSSSS
jgi:putative intracellular protease/amidase